MNTAPIVDIFKHFFYKSFELLMPSLAVSLAIVLIMAVLMAVMQIQEQTLTFLPKLLGFVVVISIMGPWMFDQFIVLISEHLDKIPELTKVK
jgi:flagellar biosynthetic protein FliQ